MFSDFCTHSDVYRYSTFDLNFLPSNLPLHLHRTCFVNVFDSFILVNVLETLKFTSSSLLRTRIPGHIVKSITASITHI